eukprot:TRINITY_DN17242_c0_g1_i1.p2 TRINITY_DN17242_c0_g1~~TRINITY_DN17242_c0_g1_i1.p2  ORF type:complete len:137 (-),score=29.34 TRINITY_DN17242_c0_g1_i1:308-718(-)
MLDPLPLTPAEEQLLIYILEAHLEPGTCARSRHRSGQRRARSLEESEQLQGLRSRLSVDPDACSAGDLAFDEGEKATLLELLEETVMVLSSEGGDAGAEESTARSPALTQGLSEVGTMLQWEQRMLMRLRDRLREG